MKRKMKTFNCYLCEKEKTIDREGLAVGSGFFSYSICKQCSREKYAIYEDKYFKDMNKKMSKNNLLENFDEEEVLIKQRQFLALIDEMVDKIKENEK